MIIYIDNREPFDPRKAIPYHNQNATAQALKHYDNLLFLTRIAQEPKDFSEKMQAEKELVICQRKIDHWRKHQNFSSEEFNAGCIERKKLWKIS